MIPLPFPPKIIEKKENTATFEIEGLWPGYGATIGNSLRRVLLSSLRGAAVTQVKISGVQHEFSTIPGVLEDVISIMLNLKQLRFKLFGDEPQRGYLKARGEKEIKAADFELPSQLEIVNKSAHLATLTDKNAKLEMEIKIERGVGYVPREARKTENPEIGEIPLDAFFTPIRKVSYRVENMRVGERTDFDKLSLEIETDGTITPGKAFYQAAEILLNHFSFLKEGLKEPAAEEKAAKPAAEIKASAPTKIKVEDLSLSSRTTKVLSENNIKTAGGILKKGEDGLLRLQGMGEKGIKEVKAGLKKLGLELK